MHGQGTLCGCTEFGPFVTFFSKKPTPQFWRRFTQLALGWFLWLSVLPAQAHFWGDKIWLDSNLNGVQDPGEPGVPGVRVDIFLCMDQMTVFQLGEPFLVRRDELIISTTSDSTGHYLFNIHAAHGAPIICYMKYYLPPGYVFGPMGQGTDRDRDSDVDPLTALSPCVTVDCSGDIEFCYRLGIDVGVQRPGLQPPLVTAASGYMLYTSFGSARVVDSALTLSDVDSVTMSGATVAISSGFRSGQDVLGFTSQSGLTGGYNATTGVLTLTGSASVAAYQAALRSVTYLNSSVTPNTAQRIVTFTVSDGQSTGAATRDLKLTTANYPPFLATTPGVLEYHEKYEGAPVDSSLVLRDLDSANITGATISITSNLRSSDDQLWVYPQSGITPSYDADRGILTLSGIASVATYEKVLRLVTYGNTSCDPRTLTRTVTFVVSDGQATATASRSIVIEEFNTTPGFDPIPNPAPVPLNAPAQTVNITGMFTGCGEDQTLSVSARSSNPALVPHPSVSYGGGSTAALSFQPAGAATGTATITVTVQDSGGSNHGEPDSASRSFLVTVVSGGQTPNNPPVANAQSISTPQDTPRAVTLTGSDPEGLPLTYSVTTPPTRGTLSGTPPNLTYTPTAGYVGADSFRFLVNDGVQNSAAATVTIAVTSDNKAPIANAQSITLAQDTTAQITLTGSDSNGDALTYSILTPPARGSLSGTPPNVSYRPAAAYVGSDSFTFKVSDGKADSAPATVALTITKVNLAPVANAQAVSTGVGAAKAITLSASDPNGDPLSYSIVTPPTRGTLTGTAPNLTYTPQAGYVGTDSFTFKASDGVLASAPAAVTISVASLPAPWRSQDIGAVGLAGSASVSAGVFTVKASGVDIWNRADSFHFVSQPLSGDGEIVARVASLVRTDPNAKAGVMIRAALTANSSYAFVAVTPDNGVDFEWRSTTGGSSTDRDASGVAPVWVKLVRSGSTFTGFKSANGTSWTRIYQVTISMTGTVNVGLAATAHKNTTLTTATFSNVTVTPAAARLVSTSRAAAMPDTVVISMSAEPVRLAGDTTGVRLLVHGMPGDRYAVQVTSDFLNWRDLAAIDNITGTAELVDPIDNNTGTHRFYRIVALPLDSPEGTEDD
jgi:hypothetical protein